jgi:HK97 family phage portal protein
MGTLTRIFAPNSTARRSLDSANPGAFLRALRGATDADITTPTSAMQIAAVYACVRVIATNIAALPLVLMMHDGQQRTPATDHPLYSLLHWLPNPEMTSIQFRLALGVHLALYGNAYAQIVRDRGGRVRELWPLRPDRINTERAENGALVYRYNEHLLSKTEIFHITHLSFDGQTGYSPITLARRTLDTKARMEQYSANFWQNDAAPGVILRHPGTLTDQKFERIRSQWDDRHRGPSQAGRTAILEQGMDITTLSIPQTDAQFLESQKFSRQEIAALFGVPAHMINDLDRATFSNIEEMAQEFIDYTLMPYLEGFRQAIHRDLLTQPERDAGYYAHFRTQALLRGKHTDRAAYYQSMQQVGALSPNDIRQLEDMNPIAAGDIYLVPLNMTSVQDAGETEESPNPARQEGDPADPTHPDSETTRSNWLHLLLADVERRLRSRIANDVRQAGAKALRTGGRTALSDWGESQIHDWRQAGESMLKPLADDAELRNLVSSAATIYAAVNVGTWVSAAYQEAVQELIANGK